MTKLEEKLVELGYFDERKTHPNSNRFVKHYGDYWLMICVVENQIIDTAILSSKVYYRTQQDIDNLQQAFNVLQQDLEVLRDVE